MTKKGNGPSSYFGEENWEILANYIKSVNAKDFLLTVDEVIKRASDFAEQLNFKHNVNKETQKAVYGWLQLFLRRNLDITLSKSLARSNVIHKYEVNAYVQLERL